MKILHTAAKFTSNISDLKFIYNSYIRSVLEYGSKVWHSSLTEQNKNDIERLQRCSVKIILKNNYQSYEEALKSLNMETLDQRREKLNLTFAKKCLKIDNMKALFPFQVKEHDMKTRKILKFKVIKAKTERYKRSSVIYMQKLLNKENRNNLRNVKSCNMGTVHNLVPNP